MMGTSEKMSSMECRFCHGLVGTEYGEVRKLERHMVNSHDIHYEKDFALALFFISNEEFDTILRRLESRMSVFKSTGVLDLQSNVFEAVKKSQTKEVFVEHSLTLVDDDGDSGGKVDEAEVKRESDLKDALDKQYVEQQEEEILKLLDSDEDDESDDVFEEQAEDSVKISCNPTEKIRRRGLSEAEEESSSRDVDQQTALLNTVNKAIESARIENTKTDRSDVSYIDMQMQRKKIQKMLLSDNEDSSSEDEAAEADEPQMDEHPNEEDSSPQTGGTADDEEVTGNSPPLVQIKVKEENVESKGGFILHSSLDPVEYSEDQNNSVKPMEHDDGVETEADPLIMANGKSEVVQGGGQKKRVFDVRIKLKYLSKRVRENIADKYKGRYDHLNLIPQFKARNYCRLCYTNPGGTEEDLRRHEEKVHQDEEESLSREFFSVADLVFRCNQCPQIPGFLTENLLNQHKAKEHKHIVKVARSREGGWNCTLCYEKIKQRGIIESMHKGFHKEDIGAFDREIKEEELTFKCLWCDKKFLSSHILKYHAVTSHSKTIKPSHPQKQKILQCGLCFEKFVGPRKTLNHFNSIHEDELNFLVRPIEESDLKFKCPSCDLKFISLRSQTHHELHRHKISERPQYQEHLSTYANASAFFKNGKYTCPLCYSSYKDSRNLSTHIKVYHQDDKEMLDGIIEYNELTVQCTECELKFVKESFMELHRGRKHKDKGFKSMVTRSKGGKIACPLCYNGFRVKELLSQHLKKVHKNDQELLNRTIEDHELIIMCSECDMKFVNERFMNLHEARIHSKTASANSKLRNNGRYSCSLCYSSYKDSRNLSTHIKIYHQDDKKMLDRTIEDNELTVQCTECELKFVKESFMELHRGRKHKDKGFKSKVIRSKARLKGGKFACPLCYNGFRDKKLLSQHLKKVHKNDREILNRTIEDHELIIQCSECEMKFVNERFMNLHEVRIHSKTPSAKSKYLKHEKKDTCPLCYISYKDSRNLSTHFNVHHQDDKELLNRDIEEHELSVQCTKCEKRFVSEKFMTLHDTRIHQKKKLFLKSDKIEKKSSKAGKNDTVLNFMRIFDDSNPC